MTQQLLVNKAGTGAYDPAIAGEQSRDWSLLVGHEEELVPFSDNAILALAHGNRTHVFVLVNDGHPKGCKRVSGEGLRVVQNFKEGAPLVPRTLFGVHCLFDVVTEEPGDRQEHQILLGVIATASEKGG